MKNQAVESTWDSMNVTNSNYIAAFARDPSRNESYILRATTNAADVGKTSNNGSGTTGSFSLQTSALGSGQALDITPAYYTVHMWLRLA